MGFLALGLLADLFNAEDGVRAAMAIRPNPSFEPCFGGALETVAAAPPRLLPPLKFLLRRTCNPYSSLQTKSFPP
jgi:hypothetical protein